MEYWQWLRSKIGSKKVFLVTTSIVLLDENQRVLLMRRGDFGTWAIPGGMLEIEENVLECAQRELREETGLTAKAWELTGIYTDPIYDVEYPNGDQMQQFTFNFRGIVSGGELRADGNESLDVKWVTQADLPWDELQIWYQHMLRDALKFESSVAFLPANSQTETTEMWREVRPFIGNEKCILPGTASIVMREDGRILLQKRADNDEWWFPCGFTDLGENAAQTTIREAHEEMGIEIEPQRIVGVFSADKYTAVFGNGDIVKNVGVLIRCKILSERMVLNSAEVSDFAWLTVDEVRDYTKDIKLADFTSHVLDHLESGCYID